MTKYQTKRSEGFTIIEVLIVLAIAGLIMLVVFLAVPSLQRNQRNQARNDDASRLSAAITECLANRNGTIASCDTDAEIEQGTMSELTTMVAPIVGGATPPVVTGNNAVGVWFGRSCSADGSTTAASTNARSFVVLYNLEPSVPRCLGS